MSLNTRFNKAESEKYISEDYNIIKKIGSGSFGDVYLADSISLNKQVAIKVEEKRKNSRIVEEYKIYRRLFKRGMNNGIPQIYDIIETPKFNILVLELLGFSLDHIFSSFNKQFSIETVLKLGIDITTLLESVHNCGYLHRDIKPNNFLIGHTDKNQLYIMDFGLSKKYIDASNNHLNLKIDRSMVGTARYASINIHMGLEPSRRDDLESVAYMLIYFLKGSLPWQGIKKEPDQDQLQLIGDTKLCTNMKKFCDDLPTCFFKFLDYTRSLKYDEIPNYDFIRSLFIDYANSNNIIPNYQWINHIIPE